MEIFGSIVTLITAHLIRPLIVTILALIIVKTASRKEANFENAITIIKWILIAFSVLSILFFLVVILEGQTGYKVFIDRVNGPYKYVYWFMLIAGMLFPLSLLNRNLGNNVYFLLLVAILMNIGWLFESVIIHITNSHREYVQAGFQYKSELVIITKGIILAIMFFLAGRLLDTKRNKTQTV